MMYARTPSLFHGSHCVLYGNPAYVLKSLIPFTCVESVLNFGIAYCVVMVQAPFSFSPKNARAWSQIVHQLTLNQYVSKYKLSIVWYFGVFIRTKILVLFLIVIPGKMSVSTIIGTISPALNVVLWLKGLVHLLLGMSIVGIV